MPPCRTPILIICKAVKTYIHTLHANMHGGLAFFNAFPVIISLFLQFAIVVCLRFRFCCNWRKRTKPIEQNIDLKFCLCHGGPKSQKITFGKDPSGPSLIYFNPCIYILHRSPILVMFGVRFVLFCMFLGIQVCFYNPST